MQQPAILVQMIIHTGLSHFPLKFNQTWSQDIALERSQWLQQRE